MKLSISSLLVALSLTTAAPVADLEKRATVPGFDISHYQATVNFQGAYNSGARFVIIKVTLSISHSLSHLFSVLLSPSFPNLIRTSLIALPAINSSGTKLTYLHTGHRRHNLHRPKILLPL